MVIQEFVFEVRCGVNEFDHCIFFCEKGFRTSGLNGDSTPDLCDASVLPTASSSFRTSPRVSRYLRKRRFSPSQM